MRGQKSRSGSGTRPGFEGGQLPMYRKLPKLKGICGGEYYHAVASVHFFEEFITFLYHEGYLRGSGGMVAASDASLTNTLWDAQFRTD